MFGYIRESKIQDAIKQAVLKNSKEKDLEWQRKLNEYRKELEEQERIKLAALNSEIEILTEKIKKQKKEIEDTRKSYRSWRSLMLMASIEADKIGEHVNDGMKLFGDGISEFMQAIDMLKNATEKMKHKDKINSNLLDVKEFKE